MMKNLTSVGEPVKAHRFGVVGLMKGLSLYLVALC